MFQSDPDTPAALSLEEEFERLARAVHMGVRDGVVDCEDAFDFACLLMERGQSGPVVLELAGVAMEGADLDRIVELARHVLKASGFEPGFDAKPGRLALLEEALEAVRSDMRAAGIPGPVALVVPEWSWPPHAFVEFRDGGYGSTTGIAPQSASNLICALVAVADETQDSVMETLGQTWPVCPAHHLGAHAREHEHKAVWWCNGDGGHIIATIGEWNSRSTA